MRNTLRVAAICFVAGFPVTGTAAEPKKIELTISDAASKLPVRATELVVFGAGLGDSKKSLVAKCKKACRWIEVDRAYAREPGILYRLDTKNRVAEIRLTAAFAEVTTGATRRWFTDLFASDIAEREAVLARETAIKIKSVSVLGKGLSDLYIFTFGDSGFELSATQVDENHFLFQSLTLKSPK